MTGRNSEQASAIRIATDGAPIAQRRKHVCIISITDAFGGMEKHIISLAQGLVIRGHKVTLAVLKQNVFEGRMGELADRINVMHIPVERVGNLSYVDARRLLNRLPGDVCILEKRSFRTGSIALDLAMRTRFRRFISIEQLEAEPLPAKTSNRYVWGLLPGIGLWWHRRRLLGRCRSIGPHTVVCVSDAVRMRLERDYLFPRSKLLTAYNGVETAQFRRDSETRRRVRNTMGVADNIIVFGMIARFFPVKRLNWAIEGFARSLNGCPSCDVRLVLVGDGPEKESLRELVARRGLDNRVSFQDFTDRPWEPLNAFDVFLMPSENEGLPFALLEALACECYAIATDVGGNREVLDGGRVGQLVPKDNCDAFCAAMEHAASMSGEQRQGTAKIARDWVQQHFHLGTEMSKVIAVVEGHH